MILFCPVCCTPLDGPEGDGHFGAVCQGCGTEFTVEVEREKVDRHSVV